jgi:putative transposase
MQEFKRLPKTFGGQHIWGRGYFAVSSGTVTDEMIMEYLEKQDEDEQRRGDNFTLTGF